MELRGQHSSVELVCEEVLPQHLPSAGDVRLAVRVASHGFCGEYNQVWVAADEFGRFLAALRQLEATRLGAAEMAALSPDEFRLAVRTVDRSRHLVVEGRLGRLVHARHWHAVEFAFEFDSSLFGGAVREFERLAQGTPNQALHLTGGA
ncbi:MAG: hypothetical protein WD069_09470 [Planctomycetales bacterium]